MKQIIFFIFLIYKCEWPQCCIVSDEENWMLSSMGVIELQRRTLWLCAMIYSDRHQISANWASWKRKCRLLFLKKQRQEVL